MECRYINIKANEELINKFKDKCKENYIRPTNLLRGFIKCIANSSDQEIRELCDLLKSKK